MKALSKAEHLAKASHNESFFNSVFGSGLQNNVVFIDWATTILFYSSLHYVDALLNHIGKDAGNHDARRKFITIEPRLRSIQNAYKWLYDRSRDARYCNLSAGTTSTNVLSWKNTHFDQIKNHVQEQLRHP